MPKILRTLGSVEINVAVLSVVLFQQTFAIATGMIGCLTLWECIDNVQLPFVVSDQNFSLYSCPRQLSFCQQVFAACPLFLQGYISGQKHVMNGGFLCRKE